MGYRVLSLDGGGAWALIEVRALMTLYGESATGHDVLRHFDLVAANSGGSLVLGGLVENLPLGELLGYFEDEAKRKAVFSPTSSWGDKLLHFLTGIGPKYSAENKFPAIQSLMPTRGNLPLSQAIKEVRRTGSDTDVHLLIVGFDYDRNRATFFRSAPAAGPQWGRGDADGITLAEAIHASTNAPVNYFDAPAQFPDRPGRYWDGGVTGCNNPVLAAVTEAIVLEHAPDTIAALTIGTASVALPWPTEQDPADSPFVQQLGNPGLVADLRKLATSILDDPPDVATFLAHVMTGGSAGLDKMGLPAGIKSRIVRMNPLISPLGDVGAWRAPGPAASPMTTEQFNSLVNLDMDAVQQDEVNAISQFTDFWLSGDVSNQPLRMNGDTLFPELGYAVFSDAADAWEILTTKF